MKRSLAAATAIAFVAVVVAACASEPHVARPAARSPALVPVAAAPTASASSTATATAAATPSAAPVADAPPPTPPFKDRTFPCNGLLCDANTEVCCGEPLRCMPRVVPQTAESFEDMGKQIAACGGGGDPTFCDDSSDCGAKETCCRDDYTSDRDLIHCKAGFGTCTYSELCVPERPCRTPHTSCIAGACARTDVKIPCGGAVCTGQTPVCCTVDGKRSCAASCAGDSFRCASARDCPAGKICQGYGDRSWCTGGLDVANASVFCASDAECAGVCAFSHGRPFCGAPQGGVRSCACR